MSPSTTALALSDKKDTRKEQRSNSVEKKQLIAEGKKKPSAIKMRAKNKSNSTQQSKKARKPKFSFIDAEAEDEDPDQEGGGEYTSDEEEKQIALDKKMIHDSSSEAEGETDSLPKLTKKDKRLSKGDKLLLREAKTKRRVMPTCESPKASNLEWESSNSEYDSDFVDKTEEDRAAEAAARKLKQRRRCLGVACRTDAPVKRGKSSLLLDDSVYLLDPSSGILRDAMTGEAVASAAGDESQALLVSAGSSAQLADGVLSELLEGAAEPSAGVSAYDSTVAYLEGKRLFSLVESSVVPRGGHAASLKAPVAKKQKLSEHLPRCAYSGQTSAGGNEWTAPIFQGGRRVGPVSQGGGREGKKDQAKKPGKKDTVKKQPEPGVYRDQQTGKMYRVDKSGQRTPVDC